MTTTEPTPTPRFAHITHLSLNNDGFATLPETDETIYIPPKVTVASRLIPGEIRTVHVLPNYPEKADNTPWLGVYVEPPAQIMPEAHREAGPVTASSSEPAEGSLQETLYTTMLEMTDAYATTTELAERVGAPGMKTRAALDSLFRAGRIVKADVWATPTQRRASATLWAVRIADLIG